MRTTILASIAGLSLYAGSACAAVYGQPGYAWSNDSTAAGTNVTAAAKNRAIPPLLPNQWEGAERSKQWNQDHIGYDRGGESGGN
jgi:hypothetical protein